MGRGAGRSTDPRVSDPERLTQTVYDFCQFVSALPTEALAEQDWGPKEVLAHLVFHHELYVHLAEACLNGTPTEPPTGTFRELNAQAVGGSRGIAP